MTIKQLCEEIKPMTQLMIFNHSDGYRPTLVEQTTAKELLKRWHKSFAERFYIESEIEKVKWSEDGSLVKVYFS